MERSIIEIINQKQEAVEELEVIKEKISDRKDILKLAILVVLTTMFNINTVVSVLVRMTTFPIIFIYGAHVVFLKKVADILEAFINESDELILKYERENGGSCPMPPIDVEFRESEVKDPIDVEFKEKEVKVEKDSDSNINKSNDSIDV